MITVTNDSCSMIFNCMLNTKTRIEIETGINDNGTSFQDCKQKCRVVLDKTRMRTKSRESTSTTSTKESQTRTYARSRTRTRTENYRTGRTIRTRTKIKSITRSRRSITSEDPGTCDCYCSMFHDPCLTPITGN